MSKDVRKEQLVLLRFEKQIVGLAALVAAGAGAAKAADGKIPAMEASAAYTDIQSALMSLANVTAHAHEALNAKALEAGLKTLQASGGVPKKSVSATVASLLGIG